MRVRSCKAGPKPYAKDATLPDSPPLLRAEALAKEFTTGRGPLTVLSDVSLELSANAPAVIMGPSGSGKSTLLNILGGLEPPTRGRVLVEGRDPFALSANDLARFRNERVGFVFQHHHLLPQCSALENVLIPTLPRPFSEATVQRARKLLERVGLGERLDHLPAELSGGESQRVAVARALINAPALLLADEPTGNLDHRAASAVVDLLLEVQREEGAGLLLVTHSRELAERFGRRYRLVDGILAKE
jgi:lipoprotein-releasing system ATP-binding protein